MDDRPNTTRFGLLRHAETKWNREKRIQGQEDSSLTPEGKAAALRWARRLGEEPWDRILSSDTGRALATAEAINRSLQLPSIADAALREQNWGQWTACTISDLLERHAALVKRLQQAGWDFRPPGGESRREVLARGLRALRVAARRWPGERILVVTHEGVIKCLVYHLTGRRFIPGEPDLLRAGHLHRLACDGTVIELEQVNALAFHDL
jgi:probable phosphoglycerate mutase